MENSIYPFKDVSNIDWLKAIEKTIPNARDYKFVTSEDVALSPFKLKEQAENLDLKYCDPYKPEQLKAKSWHNVFFGYLKNEEVTNRHILEGLNKGIDAVHLDIGCPTPDFANLLKGILTDYCRFSVSFPKTTSNFDTLASALESNSNHTGRLEGAFFGLDKDDFKAALKLFPKLHFGIKSQFQTKLIPQFVNTLKQMVDILEFDSNLNGFTIQICLTNDYFSNIAGLRAFRFLIANLLDLLGHEQNFYIETLTNHTSQADIYKNMLANCTQAMSAILGDCDGLSVRPQQQVGQEIDNFSLRISRNISILLAEEAHFDKVSNPAAGSYLIECLTQAIAEKTWQILRDSI